MTWSLTASGHTPAPEGATGWAEIEQELHDELAKILSNPRFGATASHFGGNHVTSSTLHVAKDSPEAGHVDESAPDAAGATAT